MRMHANARRALPRASPRPRAGALRRAATASARSLTLKRCVSPARPVFFLAARPLSPALAPRWLQNFVTEAEMRYCYARLLSVGNPSGPVKFSGQPQYDSEQVHARLRPRLSRGRACAQCGACMGACMGTQALRACAAV